MCAGRMLAWRMIVRATPALKIEPIVPEFRAEQGAGLTEREQVAAPHLSGRRGNQLRRCGRPLEVARLQGRVSFVLVAADKHTAESLIERYRFAAQ